MTEKTIAMVTIPAEKYELLKKDSMILNALRNAGVDNWEWYDDALNDLRENGLI